MSEQALIERLGVTDEQFDEIALLFGIVTRKSGKSLEAYASDLGVTPAELIEARGKALNTFILNAICLDDQAREDNMVEIRFDGDGVIGEFSYEALMRATVHILETRNYGEAAEMMQTDIEGMEAAVGVFEGRLAYMAAAGIKSNPGLNAYGLLCGLSDLNSFCEWFEVATEMEEEDDQAAENDESDGVEG